MELNWSAKIQLCFLHLKFNSEFNARLRIFWIIHFSEKRNKTKFILIYYYRSWLTILTRSIRPDFFSLLPVPQESNPVSETLCFGRRLGEHRCPHRASVRFKEMTIIYANLQSTLFQRQYRSSPRHILVSTASIYHCMIQRRSWRNS